MNEFTALRGLLAPGTTVYGYQRGAPVTAQVVDAWSLTVGEANDPDADVVEGDLPDDAPAERVVRRPEGGANRAAWEGYAIASGMPAEEAMVASQEDLEAVGREDEKPAPKKAARAKADPEPKVGDTIAASATKASQG